MKASFNGDIPEIPGIAVDNFEDTTKRAYFLSHCHGDHTTGLNHLFDHIDSTSVFIYMSEPSAAIVETYIDEKLKKCIKPLKLERTTITLPADEENDNEELYVAVTLIPAGHCFGSVMFLFETTLKKVLYTGDFRITENSVSCIAQLHDDNKKPIKLDVLYVDTTFQDLKYETFPKRSETIDGVVREIQKWLKQGEEYRVALVPSARYGYEYVFNEIHKRMAMKVYADQNWTLYSDGFHKYLYIHFSAMKWNNFSPEDLAVVPGPGDNDVSVCFATHCSRSELIYFVEYLAPKKVVGFSQPYVHVNSSSTVTPSKRKSSAEKKSYDERPKKVPKAVLRQIFA